MTTLYITVHTPLEHVQVTHSITYINDSPDNEPYQPFPYMVGWDVRLGSNVLFRYFNRCIDLYYNIP
jgi:hypothetical protein